MPKPRRSPNLRADAEKLADIFTDLQRCFMLNLCRDLARGHVSFPQFSLLGILARQPRLTISEVANRMGHTTAAASALVDRVEKLGLATRTTATGDRRKILVEATAPGLALVDSVRESMISNLLKMMTHLNEDEQRSWLSIYEKISLYCHNPT